MVLCGWCNPLSLSSSIFSRSNRGRTRDYKFCASITNSVFKHGNEISDAVGDILMENESGLSNSELYEGLVRTLGFSLSKRDFQFHLLNMISEAFLEKKRRGRYQIYSLTEMTKNAIRLGIWGTSDEKKRARRLCQLLLLCDHIVSLKPVSTEGLGSLLDYVNATKDKLVIESRFKPNGTNCYEIIFKPLLTISMSALEFVDDIDYGYTKRAYFYKEEGFCLEEMIKFLSGSREYPLLVGDYRYDQTEIAQCKDRLVKSGMIGQIRSYDDTQERYGVRGTFLQGMMSAIWYLHSLEWTYLDLETSWRTLTEYEKGRLKMLFGSIERHRIVSKAYSTRVSGLRGLSVGKLKNLSLAVSKLIDLKMREFYEKYKEFLKENYLISDMMDIIMVRK